MPDGRGAVAPWAGIIHTPPPRKLIAINGGAEPALFRPYRARNCLVWLCYPGLQPGLVHDGLSARRLRA